MALTTVTVLAQTCVETVCKQEEQRKVALNRFRWQGLGCTRLSDLTPLNKLMKRRTGPTPGDWKPISAESTGVALADLLMERKARGRLSAKDVCLLSCVGKHAGPTDPATEWAFHPDAALTGHCQRHMDKASFGADLFEDGALWGAYSRCGSSSEVFDREAGKAPRKSSIKTQMASDPMSLGDKSTTEGRQPHARPTLWLRPRPRIRCVSFAERRSQARCRTRS